MAKGGRKKPKKENLFPDPEIPAEDGRIPKVYGPGRKVAFSFQYAKLDCGKFQIKGQAAKYFEKLLERLKALCVQTDLELKVSRSDALRSHKIIWSETTEKNGFAHLLPPDLRDSEPWQFNVSVNKWGRIHGFYIGSVFHVVWFDPDHKLYK